MEKRPVGRPKKNNAKKAGQLKKGECRYTFITTQELVDKIKRESTKRKMSIKDYLNGLIKQNSIESNISTKPTNEDKLKEFLKNQLLNNS